MKKRRSQGEVGEPAVQRHTSLAELPARPSYHQQMQRAVVQVLGISCFAAEYHKPERRGETNQRQWHPSSETFCCGCVVTVVETRSGRCRRFNPGAVCGRCPWSSNRRG